MYELPVPYTPTIPGLNSEHLNILENSQEKRKAKIQHNYDAKQRRFAVNLKLIEERIKNLKHRRKKEHLNVIAKNQARWNKIQTQLKKAKNNEYYRKQLLVATLKLRDKKHLINIAKFKQNKLENKIENNLNLYRTILDRQQWLIKNNKELIEQCVENKTMRNNSIIGSEEAIDDFENEMETEYKSLESCNLRSYEKPLEELQRYNVHGSFRIRVLERIKNLRENFNNCEHGIAFWKKTEPLWCLVTQCLEEKPSEFEVDGSESTEKSNEKPVFSHAEDNENLHRTIMQQIMLNDVNYHMTDNMIIELVKKAKLLSRLDAPAAEIIHLTQCIVEYEADVNVNVDFFVHGLFERSVFEFTKKKIAKKIFMNARKTVDRLQHLNDSGLIPSELIKSKNKTEVTSFVRQLIEDDNVYGRFDQPIDDDPVHAALMSENAVDRMRRFLVETKRSSPAHELWDPDKIVNQLCSMKRCHKMFKRVDESIDSFLDTANHKIAHFVSTTKVDELTEFKRKSAGTPTIAMPSVYRICRKIAKLVFNMFRTEKRKRHNLIATVNAYSALVTKRTSRVSYETRVFKRPEPVDLLYFQKLYGDSDPRNKQTDRRGPFLV